ncbi:MAG: pyruvate dehydrogenase (acetyl-transferring), homodimeric type, partial [Rubrivivax sp.]|nr:pyruvate dehydrogenase (acetyl-transferring), homodimeric type [Rubrivivax sp.]
IVVAEIIRVPHWGPSCFWTPIYRGHARAAKTAPSPSNRSGFTSSLTLFRQVGIYAPQGQLYEPEDAHTMLYYREMPDGQLLEEGIHEAGALSSWIAAGTAYSVHGLPMLPMYIYYSMFGFQRVGDLIWAAADQRCRGFLFGATAGRTTLGGEGLQHQDGSSLVSASMVPTCRAWDPCFAGEVAVIMEHAMQRMLVQQCDEFHYLTLMNESYAMPSLPAAAPAALRLLGSGAILREVLQAADILDSKHGVAAEVYSVTSFSELAREARELQRLDRIEPQAAPRTSHVARLLAGNTPVVAATDYVRAWPQLIAEYLGARYLTLGTDGYGRSDTRQQLRAFFEVDAASVVQAALATLREAAREGPAG